MRILHASFLVSSLEASHRFYGDILGLEIDSSRPDPGFPGIWYSLAQGQQIHLMQLPGAKSDASGHGGRDRHVALSVTSLDALVRKFEDRGIPFTPSRSGRRALFCRDPDGNALEFVEA